jgi:hypothetical protein
MECAEEMGGVRRNKAVPAKRENWKEVTFLNCNCISLESPGRRLIEKTDFSFLLERAYGRGCGGWAGGWVLAAGYF